jgi:hypothetical protein
LIAPVKLLWAMLFCQGFLGSVLVVGWTYRLTQRSVLKYWWSRSRCRADGTSFIEFVAEQESTKAHRRWPNWFCRQEFRGALRGQLGFFGFTGALLKAFTGSLWLNLRIGLQAIFNTWVLTLPACLMWWFGWYDGWNNSFNKGYEQAGVGPAISVFGIFLFIAAMFYVPLAQARQAATGEWRAFYDFRLVWSIVRIRALSCLGLALLYLLCALPLNILKTGPMFWLQNKPHLANLTEPEVIKSLNSYFFWCALALLPAYVGLRLVAGRVYASGLLTLLREGRCSPAKLGANEEEVLERLDLLHPENPRRRHVLVRFVAWTGTRMGRVSATVALVLAWFVFVAQIYVAEFFNYHGAFGWLNQPLVQLPWFHYLPARIKNPGQEVLGAILLLSVGFGVWWVVKRIRAIWVRTA